MMCEMIFAVRLSLLFVLPVLGGFELCLLPVSPTLDGACPVSASLRDAVFFLSLVVFSVNGVFGGCRL